MKALGEANAVPAETVMFSSISLDGILESHQQGQQEIREGSDWAYADRLSEGADDQRRKFESQ